MSHAAKKGRADGRLFAIGDIHGCPNELAAMLKSIKPQAGDTVVFAGDYVDRGPSSRDVIEQLIELPGHGCECVFLKGNHEDMMLSFMGLPGHYGDSFLMNGGTATLESYGVGEPDLPRAIEHVPQRHLEFFRNLAVSYLRPPYLFVHAGVLPGRQLDEQEVEDLLWIRQEFILSPHDLGQTVLFGHTPVREVMVDLPYKIGIDTGLVYGGKLSCLELTEGTLHQIGRGSRQVRSRRFEI
jgi:serine/threonine protein phosphatase 1